MRNKVDLYLLVLLVLLLIYIAYWIYFVNYRYVNYTSSYYDLGVQANSLYWHVNGLQYYTNPVQYLVFANHLSFAEVLILPFFAVYQQPISFLVLQILAIAATALVVYFIVAELIKSRSVALAFAIAFMLSSGAIGLLTDDFHMEAFTMLLYLLAFYFYFKKRVVYFTISFSLLLGLLEVQPLQGLSLVAGVFVYEIAYNRGLKHIDKTRAAMLGIGILLVLAFFVVYYLLFAYLPTTYPSSGSQPITPIQEPRNYLSEQINVLLGSSSGNSNPLFEMIGVLGVFMFAVSFAFSSLLVPLVSIVLFSPWWGEVFVAHNFAFTWPYFQYYSYEISASIVSAILGFRFIQEGRLKFMGRRIVWDRRYEAFAAALTIITVLTSISLLGLGNFSIYLLNFAPQINYTVLNHAVSLIPSGANVLAQSVISPHLFYVRNLELSSIEAPLWFKSVGFSVYWVEPDYIILNRNLISYAQIVNASPFNQSNFSTRYSIYFNQSGTMIYKRNGI